MRDVDWLIAPDSFKGTYPAREVALAIAAGAARMFAALPRKDPRA